MNRAKEGPLSVTALPAGLRGCSLKHLRGSVADDNQQHWQRFGPVCQSSSRKGFLKISCWRAILQTSILLLVGIWFLLLTTPLVQSCTSQVSFFWKKICYALLFITKNTNYLENVISQGVQRDKKYKYNVFPTNAWYLKSLLNYSVYQLHHNSSHNTKLIVLNS